MVVRRFLLAFTMLFFLAFAVVAALQSLTPASSSAVRSGPETGELFAGAALTSPWQQLLVRAREEGWRGRLTGERAGVRTEHDQAVLWRKFKKGTGTPAFPPKGPSRHLKSNVAREGDWYQAVDVTRPRELVDVAASLGVYLHQPYSSEPWHIEAKKAFSLPVATASIWQERPLADKSFVLPAALLLTFALLSVSLAALGILQARSFILLLLPLGIFALALQSTLLFVASALALLLFAPFLLKASAPRRTSYRARRHATETREEGALLSRDSSWDWPKL